MRQVLTVHEVEDVLDKLENLIAITARVQPLGFHLAADWHNFVRHRDAAGKAWSDAIRILDGRLQETP